MEQFQLIDLVIIVLFFVVIFAIAAYYSKKAGSDTGEFFLSGRNLPWYIAGTAMVATTFAADTPLAVTELVAKNGIAGNWLWWNLAIGGMLTVFFFAKLWRRAEIMTDVEFVEIRYSGKTAAVLRGFRALYLGLFMNAIVMGWVNKAMEKIFSVTVPEVDPFLLVTLAAVVIAIYASASGLLGTARTDSFQFVFAMIGCIILAIMVVQLPEIGGLANLKAQLMTKYPQVLDFFPRISDVSAGQAAGGVLAISSGSFVAYVALQWWSSWYPGADPGGGGYIAQRMMSAKNEQHSLFATLWFTVAHYTLRPWPWIVVALAALVLLPRANNVDEIRAQHPAVYQYVEKAFQDRSLLRSGDPTYQSAEFKEAFEIYENTVDPGVMYPKLMLQHLPAGLLGLLIAVFLAAYMSTISSQLNWGTSYLMNDFYMRFIKKDAPQKHYVMMSRIAMLLMTVFSLLLTRYILNTVSGAWEFIINASAGLGAVLILRWFWWRINAWSEIAAMLAPLVIYPIVRYVFGIQPPETLYPVVGGTTIVWLAVTFLTKPVPEAKLVKFYTLTHPGGIGWAPIAKMAPGVKGDKAFWRSFINWILGVVLVYSFLFGVGQLIFAEYIEGALLILLGIAAGVLIFFNYRAQK